MIAVHAMADPEAPRFSSMARFLSYGDMDRRANQLANHLIKLGVEAETSVGICLDRSPESLISSLAVLKAGGAFSARSKASLERLRFMLNDAKPGVLDLRTRNLLERCGESCAVVAIDNNREIEKCSVAAPAIESAKDQLAYVIYTSGSTGEPKGVEITIENLLNRHRNGIVQNSCVSSKESRYAFLRVLVSMRLVWESGPI